MINLNPTEEKTKIVKDFYFRALSVFFMMLGLVMLIGVLSLVPAYITSFRNYQTVFFQLDRQQKEIIPEVDQTSLDIVQDLDMKLDLMKKAKLNDYLISTNVIDRVISKKMSGIKITQIIYGENNQENLKKVSISGIASSREQLLSFRRLFENDKSFKNVDLPISNFIKGSDIQFNLNLIIS